MRVQIPEKIGKWVFVHSKKRNRWGTPLYLYRCICGDEIPLVARMLKLKKIRRCVHCHVKKDIYPGKTFGDRTAIEECERNPEQPDRGPRWLCKCNCGKEDVLYAAYIRTGRASMCKECAQKLRKSTGKYTEPVMGRMTKYEKDD